MSVHQLFKRLQTVGKGSYGSVHKGLHIPTGNIVAIKIINLDTDDGEDVEAIQREIALLTQLRDAPNVTKYYSCHLDGPRVWIIMEFAQGGSVYSLMKVSPNGCIEEKYAVIIIREVLTGLAYLHKSSIIHRDIKAANILITASGKVMLCDFGVSALLATSSSKRNTLMGTPHWMAPEVVAVNPSYDTKADIWSLGITIHEMIRGAPPHFNVTEQIRAMEIISKAAPPRLAEADGTRDMRDFVSLCLREVPSERPTADELIKTKWMKTVPKMPHLLLQELIARYESHIAKEGPRASLAEPLPWEEEEERDRLDSDPVIDRHSWAFDTITNANIRGRMHPSFNEARESGSEDDQALNQSTIRAPATSALPTSLRAIFQEEEEINYDSFHLPGFQSRIHSPAPALVAPDQWDDSSSSSKEPAFAFPPRGRQKSASPIPPLGPGIPRKKPSAPATSLTVDSSDDSESSNSATIRNPLPRAIHDSPKPAEIIIPPLHKSNQSLDAPVFKPMAEEGRSSPEASSSRASSASRPSSSRQRSQTSTEAIRPPAKRSASYAQDTFQFPTSSSSPSKLTPPPPIKSNDRRSPSRASISSTSHKSNYSLDTNDSHKHDVPRSPKPPVSRTKSANALPETTRSVIPPSLSRAPSTIPEDDYPLIPPVKPFARRNRSGSSGSDGNMSSSSLGIPGLKEVLKVPSLSSEHHLGMTDLLPPSPSVVHQNARNFVPSPSMLGSTSGSVTDLASFREAVASPPTLPSSSFSLGIPQTHSPPAFDPIRDQPPLTGPAIQPLDYSELMGSDDMTHAELAKTVNNLTQWLSVVEFGLTGMLDSIGTDTIEEEEEGMQSSNIGVGDESDEYPFPHTTVTAR